MNSIQIVSIKQNNAIKFNLTNVCVFFFSFLAWLSDCYSSLEDKFCKENNTNHETDKLFWNKTCTQITEICASQNLIGVSASFCKDTNGTTIPIRHVIKRVLASEEYY